MYRNISYIVKRILIGTGIALLLMLIKGNLALKVSAREITMGVPTKLGFCSPSGCTIADQGQNASTYTAGNSTFYVSSYTQGTSGGVGFEWANAGLCVGQDLTFTGFAYLTDTAYSHTTITNVKGYFNSWSSNTNCSFVVGQRNNNMTRINYVCTGQGGGGLALYFHYNTDSAGSSVMVNSIQDIICDASNNDIVNSIESMNNNIINNQNENTQQIIQSITGGAEATIESQKVCSDFVYTLNKDNGVSGNLKTNGDVDPSPNYRTTSGFINIRNSSNISITRNHSANTYERIAFYNQDKTFISYINGSDINQSISPPSNAYYLRFSVDIRNDGFATLNGYFCKNGNQAIADGQQQINDTLNNDDITGASSEASSFFDDFAIEGHGLSGVITAPLRLLNSLTTSQCSPLTFELPFLHNQVSLPCMRPIYENYFGVFFTLWQMITTGMISYYVMINFYHKIHLLSMPNTDRIEVLNL